jgi:hypothetical protein
MKIAIVAIIAINAIAAAAHSSESISEIVPEETAVQSSKVPRDPEYSTKQVSCYTFKGKLGESQGSYDMKCTCRDGSDPSTPKWTTKQLCKSGPPAHSPMCDKKNGGKAITKAVYKKDADAVKIRAEGSNVNGCGPYGKEILKGKGLITAVGTLSLPDEFQPCCKDHDIDYTTCGTSKKDADEKFKNCLEGVCEADPSLHLCASRAKLTWMQVWKRKGGVKAFANKQNINCGGSCKKKTKPSVKGRL